jgi:hypothetical protein
MKPMPTTGSALPRSSAWAASAFGPMEAGVGRGTLKVRPPEDVQTVTNASKEETTTSKHKRRASHMPDVAGNGLVDRRALLGRGMLLAGAAATGVGSSLTGAAAEPLPVDPWSMEPGAPIPPYGVPAKYESKVVRTLTNCETKPSHFLPDLFS